MRETQQKHTHTHTHTRTHTIINSWVCHAAVQQAPGWSLLLTAAPRGAPTPLTLLCVDFFFGGGGWCLRETAQDPQSPPHILPNHLVKGTISFFSFSFSLLWQQLRWRPEIDLTGFCFKTKKEKEKKKKSKCWDNFTFEMCCSRTTAFYRILSWLAAKEWLVYFLSCVCVCEWVCVPEIVFWEERGTCEGGRSLNSPQRKKKKKEKKRKEKQKFKKWGAHVLTWSSRCWAFLHVLFGSFLRRKSFATLSKTAFAKWRFPIFFV